MSKDISRYLVANLNTNDYIATFDATGASISSQHNTRFSEDELAAMSMISEIVRCLCTGQKLRRERIIDDLKSDTRKIEDIRFKYEWLESGNLKYHCITESDWRYCATLEEAMAENRTFTCPDSVRIQLPSRRERKADSDANKTE